MCNMQLLKWQRECLDIWQKNGFRGIVNAVTGSGKTFLALSAVRLLETHSVNPLKIKIVVPQTFLALQWKEDIKRVLHVPSSDIGVYFGKRKDRGRKFLIYVINSARYSMARDIISELGGGNAILLIADECHHYGSAENNKIFDFYRLLEEKSAYYSLGLSATPDIVDMRSISIPLGREIYAYDLECALRDRIISRFILFSISLNFTKNELAQYEQLSAELHKSLHSLRRENPELRDMTSGIFFARLHGIAKSFGESAQLAQNVLTLIYNRRTLCHMASERLRCAVDIVVSQPNTARMILFCERISSAGQLFAAINELFPEQVGLYHSQMADNSRKLMLERYSNGALRILVCCRALDEGLNIPSTDVGIIVSTSLSARQRVQRIGRMLRLSGEVKKIYFLYLAQSNEDAALKMGLGTVANAVPLIGLRYFEGLFLHSEYTRLQDAVLGYVSSRRQDAAMLSDLDDNINLALVRGDFLVKESVCLERINSGKSVSERNYWVSVLYVIYARKGKLRFDAQLGS